MSGWGEASFVILALFAVVAAVGTIVAKSPLRAAMALLVNIVSLAGIYAVLHAQLLAAIQLIVYAGAIVVLFVFVIMLIGPSAIVPHDTRGMLVRTFGGGVMFLLALAIAFGVVAYRPGKMPAVRTCPQNNAACTEFGGIEAVGHVLYKDDMVPFELVSILLLVAIIGAVAIARGRTPAEAEAWRLQRAEAEAEASEKAERERKLAAEVSAHGGHG